jgi:hypothetical protein
MKIVRFDFQTAGKLAKYNDGSGDKLMVRKMFDMKRDITEATTDYDYVGGQAVIDDILDMFEAAVIDDTSGEIQYYLDRNDITKKKDGTASDLTGGDGSVFIIKPEFWIKEYDIGNVRYYSFSKTHISGYRKSPRFAIGKYKAHRPSAGDHAEKIVSWSGAEISTGAVWGNRTEFRTAARLGRNSKWNMIPYHIHRDITLLARAKYKTTDFQTQLGYVSRAGAADWNTYNAYKPVWDTGHMDDQGTLFSGNKPITISDWPEAGAGELETEVVSFMGIEDWFGHIWEWLDGIDLYYPSAGDFLAYITEDYTKFTDGGSGATQPDGYSLVGALPTGSAYVREMHEGEIIPKYAGGGDPVASGSRYYCDYHYASSAGDNWCAARVGGRLVNGAHSGPFSLLFFNAASHREAALGGRLGLYL